MPPQIVPNVGVLKLFAFTFNEPNHTLIYYILDVTNLEELASSRVSFDASDLNDVEQLCLKEILEKCTKVVPKLNSKLQLITLNSRLCFLSHGIRVTSLL